MSTDLQVVLNEAATHLTEMDKDCRRIFHGRGHCFDGFEDLNLDYYPPVLVVQTFREGYPVEALAEELITLFKARFSHLKPEAILLQRRYLRESSWQLLWGQLPERYEAWENGQRYSLSFMKNQNIGFFPDMRLGRELVAKLASGRRTLNLFAYTCSFSVVAAANGAEHVVNMDVSKPALTLGRSNHKRNRLDKSLSSFLPMDIMKSFGRLAKLGPYDLVVIDPPSHQGGRFVAERDYPRVIRRVTEMLNPGAHVIACLNAPHLGPEFLTEMFPQPYRLEQILARPSEYREAEARRNLKIHHYIYEA